MISITVIDESVLAMLRDVRHRLGDLSPAMHDIGESLLELTKQRIASGVDWHGAPFAPNSPMVVARKGSDRPLIEHGTLRSSQVFYRATSDSVRIGSSAVQSGVLQFGAQRSQFAPGVPWGDVPERPFLPIDPSGSLPPLARQTVLDVLLGYLS